jgi:hypothetical protein
VTTHSALLTTPRTSFTTTRILGTIGMIASPMLFLELVLTDFDPSRIGQSSLFALGGLLFVVGWMCSAVGLWLLRATGNGIGATVLLAIQLIGLTLAGSQQVQDILGMSKETLFYGICDVAWPASVLFMLVIGTLVLRAKVLTGWRRFAPLFCGLTLPLFMLLMVVVGFQIGGVAFGPLTFIAWALLGYTIRTARPL